ncbi:MAG: hypothetical protein M1837_001198 [Sclerophora amabilis]|nr:MAG: hypothetical protein M1837_001198 [Sclerophora amabilis]
MASPTDDELGRSNSTDAKSDLIESILREDDLYKILGATTNASAAQLRRCYLERSKICHPDKPPCHPHSTSAFQKVGFAFDILKSPSSRRTYDASLRPAFFHELTDRLNTLGYERTFHDAVCLLYQEFMNGDFGHIRRALESLNRQYPNLISHWVIEVVLRSFVKIQEVLQSSKAYSLLMCIELGRIGRVTKGFNELRYTDVVGCLRLTIQLARVTLALPMRFDRALRLKAEKDMRAKTAGMVALGLPIPEASKPPSGFLNDRVITVLEFIVGEAGHDEAADAEWYAKMGESSPPN